MTTSVVRAFFHSGSRNAGTPLVIASTPVTAAPPDAKAWSTTYERRAHEQAVAGAAEAQRALCVLGRRRVGRRVIIFAKPTPSSTTMFTMKKYVGTAKSSPGLPDAAQVAERDDHDEADRDGHPVRA